MAAPTYGSYQPGAVDPWNIETTLAKEAITSPADAQRMLGSYEQQRQAQGYVYGQEADRQHEFAKQQLADQMVQARMKLIPELVGKPGGGAFLAGGGIEGVGPGAGGNAAAWSGLGQAGQQHDFAQNYDLIGKATEGLSRAGQDVAIQQIPGYTNLKSTGAGQHSDITVEDKKAALALQLAAQKAKSGGGDGAGSGITTTFDTQDAYGGTEHHSAGKKVPQSEIDRFKESRGQRRIDPQTPPQGLPGGAERQAAPANAGTQAPAASTPASRNGVRVPPPPNTPQNSAAGVAAAQRDVLANEHKLQGHPSYPDYLAGKAANGGKPLIRMEGGKPVLYGGSGNPL